MIYCTKNKNKQKNHHKQAEKPPQTSRKTTKASKKTIQITSNPRFQCVSKSRECPIFSCQSKRDQFRGLELALHSVVRPNRLDIVINHSRLIKSLNQKYGNSNYCSIIWQFLIWNQNPYSNVYPKHVFWQHQIIKILCSFHVYVWNLEFGCFNSVI